MNPQIAHEQLLLNTWRQLPEDRQQEVIDFVEFLAERLQKKNEQPPTNTLIPEPGETLTRIRKQIVESGMPLLSSEEIAKEILERRGGYQE